MKLIEDQVCSLELAKRLKELGMKQYSLWYWFTDSHFEVARVKRHDEIPYPLMKRRQAVYSAYTIAELGEMLPSVLIKYDWHVQHRVIYKNFTHITLADTETDARGKMLIYLLENGVIRNERI